jgi:hypothetical protein
MTNAEKFQEIFKKFATEVWAFPEKDFLTWLNAEYREPRKGYLSIDDVMSVFDDFMCGEVDEDGTETFLEMLKDKSESEEWVNFADDLIPIIDEAESEE